MLLTSAYPALLLAVLALWAACAPAALGRLRRRLAAAEPATAFLLVALVLAALALRAAHPAAHRVFDDEFEHLDAARRISSQGIYGVAVTGGRPDWSVYAAPTWPAGHHAALAAWMLVAGPTAAAAKLWSALLSALALLLIFWATWEAFDDQHAALAAVFAWAALPLAARYAAACDLTSSSLFWSAAALAAIHARERAPSAGLDAFASLTLLYAVQVRPENAVLIFYFFAVCSRRILVLPAVLGALIPASIALSNHAQAVAGYAAADFAPLTYLLSHIRPDLMFLFSLPVFTPLALAVAVSVRRPKIMPLALLSAAYFVLYACFFRGDFSRGAEDRYALSVLLPLAVAAAGGLAAVARPAVLLFLILGFISPPPAEPVEHERARRLLAAAAASLDAKTVVIGFNASKLLETAHRPAASAYFVLEDFEGFKRSLTGAGAGPALALWKDWGYRYRRADGERLEKLLSKRCAASVVARDGDDELVIFTPR